MYRLISLSRFILTLTAVLLANSWRVFVILIDIIDGDDEVAPSTDDKLIYYNYRTGELDPIERIDGLYDHQ